VIIWEVQAYNRKDEPTIGETSLLKGREVLWADLKRIASRHITTLGVIIGGYTIGKTTEKWAAALQRGGRGRRIELIFLGGE